jgi:hypothetical protein
VVLPGRSRCGARLIGRSAPVSRETGAELFTGRVKNDRVRDGANQ